MNRLGNRLLAVLLSALLLLSMMPASLAEEVKADAPLDSLRFHEDAFKKQVTVTTSTGTYLYLGSGSSYTINASDLIVKNTQGKTLSASEYTLAVATANKKLVSVAKDLVTIKAKKKNETGTAVTITATAGGVSKSLSLVVACPGKPTVSFKNKAIETASTTAIDLSKQLIVGPVFTAADGKLYNLMGVATFTASKKSFGTVTADGMYTPGAAGTTAVITAKAGGKKTNLTVYNGQETASIVIKDAAGKVVPLYDASKTEQTEYGVNKTKKAMKVSFTAQALAADGKTAAACQSFTWATSDKKIGTVKVAKKTGVATVTLKKTKKALVAPQTLIVSAVSATGANASFVMQLFPQGGTTPSYSLDVTPVVDQSKYGKTVQYYANTKKLWIDNAAQTADLTFELGASMKAPSVTYTWTTANAGMEVKDGKLIVKQTATGKGVLSISTTDATASSTTLEVEVYEPIASINAGGALRMVEGGTADVTPTLNASTTYTGKDLIWTVLPDAPYVTVSTPDATGKVTITAGKDLPFGDQDYTLETQISVDSPDPMGATANIPVTIEATIDGLVISLADTLADKYVVAKDPEINAVTADDWFIATATNPGTPDDDTLIEWSFAASKDFTTANWDYKHKVVNGDFSSTPGKYTVTAAVKGAPTIKDTMDVYYYKDYAVDSVKFPAMEKYYTKANAPTQLAAKGYAADGITQADNGTLITYENNDASTATIDATGKVTFVDYGKVSATATAQEISDEYGPKSAKIEYTVVEHSAASIVADEGNATSVVKGKTAQMKALVKSADKIGSTTELFDADVQDVIWSVPITAGISIDPATGVLTATDAAVVGTIIVTATAKDTSTSASVTATFEVLVVTEMPAAIKVTVGSGTAEKEFSEGDAYVEKPFAMNVFLYSDAACKTKAANQEIVWTTSDATIATVPVPTGVAGVYTFTPVKATTAPKRLVLTATSKANPAVKATLRFDVVTGANAIELALTDTATRTFKVGSKISVSAKVLDTANQPAKDQQLTWKVNEKDATATWIKDYTYELTAPETVVGSFSVVATAKSDTSKSKTIADLQTVNALAQKIAITKVNGDPVETIVYAGQTLNWKVAVTDNDGKASDNQNLTFDVTEVAAGIQAIGFVQSGATLTGTVSDNAALTNGFAITVKATSAETTVKTPATLTLPGIKGYSAINTLTLQTSDSVPVTFTDAAPWQINGTTVTAAPKVLVDPATGTYTTYKWELVSSSTGVTINAETGAVTFPSATEYGYANIKASALDGSPKTVTGKIEHGIALTSITLSSAAPVKATAITTTLDPTVGTVSYAWYRSTDKTAWSPIAGATSYSYTPSDGDIGSYLKVVATGTGYYVGTKVEAATTSKVVEKWTVIASAPASQKNADKVTVSMTDNVITITANVAGLEKYKSSNLDQNDKEYAWVALAVDTGKDLVAKQVKIDTYSFIQADIDEANGCGVTGDNSFIFWVKAEETQYVSGRTFKLSAPDMLDTNYVVKVNNTATT